jgi:methyl-accepting chemotaxis protein
MIPHASVVRANPLAFSATDRTGGLSDFFRYHGFWAPGVRLFRAIGFRSKALVLTAVFMFPIALLSWQFFTARAEAIDFTRTERDGVAALQAFMPVLKGVIDTRNATRATLGGHDGAAAYNTARQDTERALAALAQDVQARGDPMKLMPALARFKDAWAATASARNGADAEGRTVFGPVTATLIEMLNQIGDESGLVLDPDLDSFYMINSLVLTLPGAMEELGQLWGWGTYVLAKGAMDPKNEAKWHVWSARATSGLEDARKYFARSIKATPELKAALDLSGLDAGAALVRRGAAAVAAPAAASAADYFREGAATLNQMGNLYAKALPVLDGVLQKRQARLEASRNLAAAVLVLALAVAMYLFIAFRKVLDGGLKEVAFHIDAMRDGDLTTSPRAWGADEAAGLMHTLVQMQDSLRRIVSQVRGASDGIVDASTEIAGGAVDLCARTEQSAANLEETASAMEQIAATVKHNESTVDEATRLAMTNAQAAERGGRIIGEVVATMQAINGSSSRIGDIIGTIDGIAFQTNILALNAAVEAARAGEQGRGFAVVASEVRALAQRSSAAAREIKTLITASVEQVEGGVRVVQQAGDTITEMMGTAHRVRELLSEVAVGAREQTAGVAQSAKAVQELDTVTQQNAALVEQTAAAAGSLKERAQGLAGEVAQFRLPA